MSNSPQGRPTNRSPYEAEIQALYRGLLDGWNRRSAHDYATLFADDAHVVGYDGSLMNGRVEIEQELSRIFAVPRAQCRHSACRSGHGATRSNRP